MRVLVFGIRHASEGSAKADAHSMLRRLLRIRQAGIVERHFCRCHRELGVAVEPLQAMRWKVFFRGPLRNLTAAMRVERRGVEAGNALDATLLRAQAAPKILPSNPDAGDWADAGNDCATPRHFRFGICDLR